MTLLIVLIAISLLVPAALAFGHLRASAGGEATDAWLPISLVCLLLPLAAAMYAGQGAFGQWQTARVDERIDYQLAGRITEARRELEARPGDVVVMRKLAGLYSEGSRYSEAASLWQQVRLLEGEKSELFTREAEALYYRDGRILSQTSSGLIARALAIDPFDLQSRLLLATAFYQAGAFSAARGQWQWLLDSNVGETRREAIERAIARVDARIEARVEARLKDNRVNP
ncbi:tetratricopeptide repeat protein [Shewanella khirikhana]|uniref:Formate-dependent nitrite reductase complex subunit NrfG n=1 Tax=Shewanella khirikhana TaxID=1965282 RepID=A0ABM7DWY7_9GAMM|nr:hypothetical protein [Shewanella khirikhana]AZQ13162.1 formate-dependent nitrite reductase complex subunit NrfG [Shewanella khirikhana]